MVHMFCCRHAGRLFQSARAPALVLVPPVCPQATTNTKKPPIAHTGVWVGGQFESNFTGSNKLSTIS